MFQGWRCLIVPHLERKRELWDWVVSAVVLFFGNGYAPCFFADMGLTSPDVK